MNDKIIVDRTLLVLALDALDELNYSNTTESAEHQYYEATKALRAVLDNAAKETAPMSLTEEEQRALDRYRMRKEEKRQQSDISNTLSEIEHTLDDIIESARLLGATDAKRGFGCFTEADSRFMRAMYQSIDKRRNTICSAFIKDGQLEQKPIAMVTGFYGGFPTIQALEPGVVFPHGLALYRKYE